MNEYEAHLRERGVSPEDIAPLPAPPQPPFSEALQSVLACAHNLGCEASVVEHCRYPESSLRGDVEDLRDACVAYLAGLPEEPLPPAPWAPFDSDNYEKVHYEVQAADGSIVLCWPNAGQLNACDGTGREWGANAMCRPVPGMAP